METFADRVAASMKRLNMTQTELARRVRVKPQSIQQILSGRTKRTKHLAELARALRVDPEWLQSGGESYYETPNDPEYLAVEILPTFVGMGGGGTGDGDQKQALLPRHLIEDELRAKPTDLLVIEARGDSMAPLFMHGDQVLIDKRDANPRQPGPFALWDGDGFVLKLVERVPGRPGWYRVFSANDRYSDTELEEGQCRIMGRPVWFARRI